MSGWCLLCRRKRRATQGYRTCIPCCDALRDTLTEITTRHTRLCSITALLPGSGDDGRKPGGYASQSPARDRVIAMLDPRTVAVEPGDPHSVLAILTSWANLLRDHTNQTPPTQPPTVRSEASVLDAWMDYLTRQDWIDECAHELTAVRDQLRSATGEPNPKPVGHCINTLDEGATTRECGAALFAPTSGTALQCQQCGRSYDGLDLVKLELAQEAGSESTS